MKLVATGEERLDWAAIMCRQSPTMQLVGSLILSGLFGGAPVLWWWLDAPVWVTGMCGLVALLVIPICLNEAVSALKKTNWLMCIQADGIWLNLRSFRNRKFAPALTSVHFPWNDLKSAAAADGLTRISLGAANDTRVSYLEIQLADHVAESELRDAIAEETKRRSLPSKFAGVESRGRAQHVPVRLTDERRLQIAWRSPMDSITPGLGTVLQELSRELEIDVEPAPQGFVISHSPVDERDDVESETAAPEEQVRMLITQGKTLQAIQLYRQQTGCGLKDAKDAVDRLIDGA